MNRRQISSCSDAARVTDTQLPHVEEHSERYSCGEHTEAFTANRASNTRIRKHFRLPNTKSFKMFFDCGSGK